MNAVLYTNLRDAAGQPTSVLCRDGRITALRASTHEGATVVDGEGRLLMPAFVEPHVHLDKTLWGEPWQAGISSSRLMDYITNERKVLSACKTPIATRAGRLLEQMLAFGTTAIRSHVDVAPDIGLAHVEAMMALRKTWADRIDLQFVAFPQQGLLIQPGTIELLRDAVGMGVETVGGLDPAGIDGDPDGQLRAIFGLAEKTGTGIDIHLHDKGDLGAWQVGRICDHVEANGLQGRTMISHAYCLGMIADRQLERLGRRLADLKVSVMTSAPADVPVPPVAALTEMGVNVCCGSDGIRDAWSPLGNGDMLERAFLTAFRFEWSTDEQFALALACATDHAARALGLADRGLAPGGRADFLMVDAANPGDALARRPHRRRVVRGGRLVADDGRLL